MTAAFRANAGGTYTSGSDFTLNKPAGVVAGDLMLALLCDGYFGDTITAPAGWTSIASGANTKLTRGFKKIAGGSEPSTYIFTVSGGDANATGGQIAAYSGTNLLVDVVGAIADTDSGTPLSLPSITVVNGGILISLSVARGAGSTLGTPSAFTRRPETTNTGDGTIGTVICDITNGSTGATGDILQSATTYSSGFLVQIYEAIQSAGISETVTAADSSVATTPISNSAITETVTALDTSAVGVLGGLTETLAAADSSIANAIFGVSIIEPGAAAETIAGQNISSSSNLDRAVTINFGLNSQYSGGSDVDSAEQTQADGLPVFNSITETGGHTYIALLQQGYSISCSPSFDSGKRPNSSGVASQFWLPVYKGLPGETGIFIDPPVPYAVDPNVTTISKVGGGRFDLLSIDLGPIPNRATNGQTMIRMRGYRGATEVVTYLATAVGNMFTTFSPPGFENLDSFTLCCGGFANGNLYLGDPANSPFYQFNYIVLQPTSNAVDTETASILPVVNAAISEGVTSADSTLAVLSANASIAEVGDVTESIYSGSVTSATQNESGSAIDVLISGGGSVVFCNEALEVTDYSAAEVTQVIVFNRSIARTYAIPVSNLSAIDAEPTIRKQVAGTKLDYSFDWTEYLAQEDDAITDFSIGAPAAITTSDISIDGAIITLWAAVDVAGYKHRIQCQVTTEQGRTDLRFFVIEII